MELLKHLRHDLLGNIKSELLVRRRDPAITAVDLQRKAETVILITCAREVGGATCCDPRLPCSSTGAQAFT